MNRSMYNALMKKMDETIRQTAAIEEKIDEQRTLLEQSSTQQYLHPIPRPRQGKEMNRSVNVAGYLRMEIETRNENIPSGGRKYLQFPSSVDDDRLNRDAIRTLGGLLSYHLTEDFGYNTWEQTYIRRPRLCEKLVREASAQQDLKVFAQAAAQWAIRMLLSSKMKSRKRSLTAQKNVEDSEEDAAAITCEDIERTTAGVTLEEVATSTVPELVVDGCEVTLEERVGIQQRGLQNSGLNIENSANTEIQGDRNVERTALRFQNGVQNLQGATSAVEKLAGGARDAEVTIETRRGAKRKGRGSKGQGARGRGARGRGVTVRGATAVSRIEDTDTTVGSLNLGNRKNISKRRRVPR